MLRAAVKALTGWVVMLLVGAWGLGACASAGARGPPLDDPTSTAERLRAASGAEAPQRIRFRWEYGDEQGRLRGDGVARINPPDSFRLDLFTSGEGSMAVALADSRLSSLGQIEDVELPEAPFLYAMAGLFRPAPDARLDGGHANDGGSSLTFEGAGGRLRTYTFEEDRLVRLEERLGGRVSQRIVVSWASEAGWPRSAEYRDLETPRRVEWRLEEAVEEPSSFPHEIFDLPSGG